MYISLVIKYPLFLSDFNENWFFSTDFRKIIKNSFIKIHLVGAELFYMDRWTDGQKDRRDKTNRRDFAIVHTRRKQTIIITGCVPKFLNLGRLFRKNNRSPPSGVLSSTLSYHLLKVLICFWLNMPRERDRERERERERERIYSLGKQR